jgi:hypothetical protein
MPRAIAVVVLVVFLALVGAAASAWGAFTDQAASSGNQITAAPDFVAPTVASSVIQKTEGGIAGYIRRGGTYRVYASAGDAGNPASGIASVTGDLGSVTTGLTGASLAGGSFTVDGQAYNRQSASLTANAILGAGAHPYSLSSADNAGNARTQTGFSVIVDNTAPTGTTIDSGNKTGNTAGKPEIGDTVTFTYDELIDPNSVLSGWTGSATNVVVRIDDNVAGNGSNDVLTVYNSQNSSALPLGTVDLGHNNYVGANSTFGATGNASKMAQSAGAITVTLGTASGSPTTGAAGTTVWSPASGATDRAGNHSSTATVTETGAVDKEF